MTLLDQSPPFHAAWADAIPAEPGLAGRPSFVLIVDDQAGGRKILEELVRAMDPGLVVESFAEPEAALARAQRQPPDLILTD
ncbi:MAG: response regulator, partial [Pseudomonadota bacterium]